MEKILGNSRGLGYRTKDGEGKDSRGFGTDGVKCSHIIVNC